MAAATAMCLVSTSVRATLRMRAIYKNQFLPWQRNAHNKQKRKTKEKQKEKVKQRSSSDYSDGKQTNKPETNSARNK